MAAAFVVAVEGLKDLARMDDVPEQVLAAARRAVNRTTDRARARSARLMREQINFPARYLSGEEGRLQVVKYARGRDLEGIIRGRDRPTSLARFKTSGQLGEAGVSIAVKPGLARRLPRAFLVRLRSGNGGALNNLGLAIRTRDGQAPRAAYRPLPFGKNLWLLYGPSVDQVFRSVAEDVKPETADFLEREFQRLLDLEL